jgi:membrane fusion protein (multidrug efflux system)
MKVDRQRGGMLLRLVLLVVVPIAAGILVLDWYARSARYVSTDNAYVKADMIAIAPSINGRVTVVHVVDNQTVAEGDILFELDPRPHRIALNRADAQLASIRNELESMRAEYAQITAEIEDASERVRYLERQHNRQQELARKGMATEATIDEIEYQVIQARQALQGLREKAKRQLAELGGNVDVTAEHYPRYMEALTDRKAAELALEYTVVRAPAGGTVSRVQLQPGEWVEEGDPVFRLIENDGLWIEANLKETQLTYVQVGQEVSFEVDAYPGTWWKARIASISPATGSEFLVLPPQNATGNWVKVVQRVPVRIELMENEEFVPLRAGMTVDVKVDTNRDRKLLTIVREAVASIRGD